MKTCRLFARWLGVGLFVAVLAAPVSAQVRMFSGYDANTFAANDDGSTGPVNIGFTLNFLGTTYQQLWVNNNGNVTFVGPFGVFNPSSPLSSATLPMIAPFLSDVDTHPYTGSSLVTYGAGSIGGYNALAVNWVNVGPFGLTDGPKNSFQLLIVDRSDTGANNFDFEFNYSSILWESGTSTGGNGLGLGGMSAAAGYADGAGSGYLLAGSTVNGAFTDFTVSGGALTGTLNPTGLANNQAGTPFDGQSEEGRFAFSVRNGVVTPPTASVPDGTSSLVLAVLGLAGLVALGRFRRVA